MMKIIIPKTDDMSVCAKAYINAYQAEPWNEIYRSDAPFMSKNKNAA